MDITDFGVDLDTLPKLVLDEAAGRKMFERFLKVKTFRVGLNLSKEVYFRHYLANHLDVKDADWSKEIDIDEWKAKMKPLKRNHELVWNAINDIVNRHTFLIITAWASLEVNVLNDDDKEFVQCNAYRNSFSAIINGAIEADEMAAFLHRRLKGDTFEVLDASVIIASRIDDAGKRFRNTMSHFVKDGMIVDDYSKDMPVHRRH